MKCKGEQIKIYEIDTANLTGCKDGATIVKMVTVESLKRYIGERRTCPNNIPASWELDNLEEALEE